MFNFLRYIVYYIVYWVFLSFFIWSVSIIINYYFQYVFWFIDVRLQLIIAFVLTYLFVSSLKPNK